MHTLISLRDKQNHVRDKVTTHGRTLQLRAYPYADPAFISLFPNSRYILTVTPEKKRGNKSAALDEKNPIKQFLSGLHLTFHAHISRD